VPEQVPRLAPYAQEVAFGIVVVVVTYLSLVLGELVPKRIALAHAESIASFVALPMEWVARITSPLVWLLQVSTEAATRLLPPRSAGQTSVSEDEIRAMIATGTKEGVFHRREKEMIDGVLRLADRSVESVKVPYVATSSARCQEPWRMWNDVRAAIPTFCFVTGAGATHRSHLAWDLGEAVRTGSADLSIHVSPHRTCRPSRY
jgi:Mg2+/Co2+ transporter CorB